ncbi:MAG: TlpA family protein disulfide reductase [Flavobacteriaceae bacterium]|nr:TlpA family protein disulfide reductase [Flavobacteriaceae bacterium]
MENYTFRNSSTAINNEFSFTINSIEDDFPRPYKLGIVVQENVEYINSNIFYVQNTNQKITFDATNGRIHFSKDNLLYDDIQNFNHFFADIYSKKGTVSQKYYKLIINRSQDIDSLKLLEQSLSKIDSIENDLYLQYAIENPKSYVLFWNLVSKTYNRYKPIYQQIFENLDDSVTKTNIGEIFRNDLIYLKYFEKNIPFPSIEIDNINILDSLGGKYTFIDFWFSYCQPCLIEMPKHKTIYDKYKSKGFEYIGISTDGTQDIENWKKVIQKYDLTWKNILDENGVESKKYLINKFPTTFLLDSGGKIIKKDISPEELEKFLEENLK